MKQKKVGGAITITLCSIFATLGFLLIYSAFWFTRSFDKAVGLDAVIYTLFSEIGGANTNVIWEYIIQAVLPTVLCSAGVIFLLFLLPKILFKKKLEKGKFLLFHRLIACTLILALFFTLSTIAVKRVKLDEYIAARLDSTTIFEDYYADPQKTEIIFPEEKRNLIYIYLESMEMTYLSTEQGGASETNLIPELSELAENNINFSQGEGLGGARTSTGSTWTIAAMISTTAGVPLSLPKDVWTNGYKQGLPGITTMNDVLHDNGYYQALMVGSDASFGGRREYFSLHNVDAIYDLFTAREEGLVPSDYWNNFWGFEDAYLFQYAKEKLTQIAKTEKPFAFTMLTVDTHHPDGYSCYLCENKYDDIFDGEKASDARNKQFANVISCSSRQVSEFVQWIQQQDFYENTTIVITGDHYSMNGVYMDEEVPTEYSRRVYNCFLNTAIDTEHAKNRDFTTLDMFPTTLAAIGCQIQGDRLGLGTNLFSGRQTLAEKLGFDYLCTELNKPSSYYENTFMFTSKKER